LERETSPSEKESPKVQSLDPKENPLAETSTKDGAQVNEKIPLLVGRLAKNQTYSPFLFFRRIWIPSATDGSNDQKPN